MKFIRFKYPPDHDFPTTELNMTDCTEHLSDEHICRKVDVADDDKRTEQKIIDCKIEDLGGIFILPGSRLEEEEEKVGRLDIESFTFHYKAI